MPLFAGVFAMLRGRHPSRIEWVGLVDRLPRRDLAQRRQRAVGFDARPGVPDHRAARLGLGFDLEPRPGPAGAVHGRRGADARRQRVDADRRRARRGRTHHDDADARVPPPRCCTWSSPVRSSASPPTSGCCTTCARRWRPATPTSIRRSRCCSARCSAAKRFTAHDLGAMAVILAGVVIITLAKARAGNACADARRPREAAERARGMSATDARPPRPVGRGRVVRAVGR